MENLIKNLIAIKMAIINGATDVIWMDGDMPETACERIDGMLIDLGVSLEELEGHYQGSAYQIGGLTLEVPK